MVGEKREYIPGTPESIKTSKTMLPRRKRETREEILKQDQWSHCLKKRKASFSWEGVNYLFTNDEI